MQQCRVLLEEGTPESVVDGAAWTLEWSLVRAIAQTENQPHEVIWLESHSQTSIHYIEDFVVQRSYLVVCGVDTTSTLEDIKGSLPTVGSQDFWQPLEPTQMCKAIVASGICHWHVDNPALFARLQALCLDPHEAVRLAIVTAQPCIWSQ
jgi:hypothetical protein